MQTLKKRMIAYLMIAALMAGLCPTITEKKAEAATASVTLANLGSLGSLSVGSKTKSGNWWMMKVNSKKAFCLNLGYTCHTGDVYQDQSTVYNSSADGANGLKAHIGYWYDTTMKESRKAYVLAQALFWAVEEGDTTKTKLKNVISKVKSNTGYFSKTANQLYSDIFENENEFSVSVKVWTYSGSGSHRQKLLMIDSTVKTEPKSLSKSVTYRQKIRLHKVDEDKKPMAGARFQIESENVDELYAYSLNGDASGTDEDIVDFVIDGQTDSNGWLNLRLRYQIQSNDYFYLDADTLKGMDQKAKDALVDQWAEEGYTCAPDLTKASAEEMAKSDVQWQMVNIRNNYKIKEVNSGNPNMIINPGYKKGQTVTLNNTYSWSDVSWASDVGVEEKEILYSAEILDKFKKVKINIKKVDGYSSDKKAHGEATLEGAVFGIYSDAACTKAASYYDQQASAWKTVQPLTIKNGQAETGWMRCGTDYYIKELQAPTGYRLNTEVKKITLVGSNYPDTEFNQTPVAVQIDNQPILGKVALQKYTTTGGTEVIHPEVGAVFQVYLQKDKDGNVKTYETCDDYERDTLVIDENGYACSHDLYYGEYWLHQVSTGGQDVEKMDDQPVTIKDPDRKEPIRITGANKIFKAYLKIIKKDGNTTQTVLKAGTSYQIYRVEEGGKETLVKQEYNDGHKKIVVDTFSTDESGQIMTVEPLLSGTYRIYETDAATGYHINTPYIEVEINSEEDNYTSETDVNGNVYSVVEAEYINYETYGKLSILKTGEQLTGFADGKFVYEQRPLNGVEFDIYADGDIVTQDNREGSTWFLDGELVGTVTTGKGASFMSDCGGITGYDIDEEGVITVNLPLGKYRIKEKKTLYGYVLPEEDWQVEFTWENKEDTYVLNTTDATDGDGVMNVQNSRAKGRLLLEKIDAESSLPIMGAVFGIYTKDAIFNADGEQIVEAGTKIGSLTTDAEGKAETDANLPLMSEGYVREAETASGSAIKGTEMEESGGQELTLNSGDYYLKEEAVSDSYYLDTDEILVHLEYQDEETVAVEKTVRRTNRQTTAEVDKTTVTGSEEIPGCKLEIHDAENNVIVSWTSGDRESVKFNGKDSGYANLAAKMTDTGHLVIGGLKHNTEYILTETRPADGYVTADSIAFQLVESAEKGKTLASLKQKDGSFAVSASDVIHMVDETTEIRFRKKTEEGKLLAGAKIAVYDSKGRQVTSFRTKKGSVVKLDGILTVGETYTFQELEAPEGYEKAKAVKYTVKDTKKKQVISMVDKKMGIIRTKTPDSFRENNNTSPQTGYLLLLLELITAMSACAGGSIYAWRKYYGKSKK